MSGTPPTPSADQERETRAGSAALGLGLVVVVVAGAVLLWSGLTTASGRIAGTTTNETSLFQAGSIDISLDGGADGAETALRLDADGLYPGLVAERCIPVTYRGTFDDADVRLFGEAGAGSGLDEFLDTTVQVGVGSDNECADFEPGSTIFEGPLAELWRRHGDFGSGLDLLASASDGASVTVRVATQVESDDAAQGKTTEFWMIIEARP